MPTWLRRFFIRNISEENRKRKEEAEKAQGRENMTTKKFSGKKRPSTGKPSATPSKPYLSKAPAK